MADGHGNVLTWDPRGTLDGQNSAARRRAALSGQSYPVGSYVTLDNQLRPSSYEEYPFAATLQGGAGAHVEKVPLWQQFVQGGLIRGACAVQNCQAGDTVHVYIVPGNVYTPPPE
nr:NucA/NucB deoxyribonuclease domain-containing protein [Aliiroseovarius crassostreae]